MIDYMSGMYSTPGYNPAPTPSDTVHPSYHTGLRVEFCPVHHRIYICRGICSTCINPLDGSNILISSRYGLSKHRNFRYIEYQNGHRECSHRKRPV